MARKRKVEIRVLPRSRIRPDERPAYRAVAKLVDDFVRFLLRSEDAQRDRDDGQEGGNPLTENAQSKGKYSLTQLEQKLCRRISIIRSMRFGPRSVDVVEYLMLCKTMGLPFQHAVGNLQDVWNVLPDPTRRPKFGRAVDKQRREAAKRRRKR
jgi:hypothetical protein